MKYSNSTPSSPTLSGVDAPIMVHDLVAPYASLRMTASRASWRARRNAGNASLALLAGAPRGFVVRVLARPSRRLIWAAWFLQLIEQYIFGRPTSCLSRDGSTKSGFGHRSLWQRTSSVAVSIQYICNHNAPSRLSNANPRSKRPSRRYIMGRQYSET